MDFKFLIDRSWLDSTVNFGIPDSSYTIPFLETHFGQTYLGIGQFRRLAMSFCGVCKSGLGME